MALPREPEGVMPQFYFDVAGERPEADFEDLEGVQLADLDEARSQAIKFAGEMLQHDSHEIWDGHDLRVEVSDANRLLLLVVTVSAISIFPSS